MLPFGLTHHHVRSAMVDFVDFLGFINAQLLSRSMTPLERMLMPANFSSLVSEFMVSTLPKYCGGLVKNRYHNGHPDLVPAGRYTDDRVSYGADGIEVKASRYMAGWQGHNPEDAWLLVFMFECTRPPDVDSIPFRFIRVAGASLSKADWNYAGRTGSSRRTITASVGKDGSKRVNANAVYSVLF